MGMKAALRWLKVKLRSEVKTSLSKLAFDLRYLASDFWNERSE